MDAERGQSAKSVRHVKAGVSLSQHFIKSTSAKRVNFQITSESYSRLLPCDHDTLNCGAREKLVPNAVTFAHRTGCKPPQFFPEEISEFVQLSGRWRIIPKPGFCMASARNSLKSAGRKPQAFSTVVAGCDTLDPRCVLDIPSNGIAQSR